MTDGAASGGASLWDSCFSNAKHDRVFHLEPVELAALRLSCELRGDSEITTVVNMLEVKQKKVLTRLAIVFVLGDMPDTQINE
ncbi:hypothetical protein EYF80_042864 [Liparis tanakae]|uniref:Uncharacterized protein n=1 Tax=Liparis tanakae TaxID=230148 RepID=A0A4Z2G040_9TELE|nr:hypothetical protein EYF80_042864 [Liparis tanakae]